MNLKKKLSIWVLVMVLVFGLGFASVPPAKARLVLNKQFSPSAATYTNKTFHFQDSDPYTYAYWQYNVGTTTNTQNNNKYIMDTDTNGDYAYFGFDEFVNHSVVSAQVIFETTLLVGTYHFQPLAYFYQKTNLESNTRWALALDWDSSGIDLYYNTGNGNTPTSVNLNNTAPTLGAEYKIILSNLDVQTYVYIQDLSTYPYPVIYEGYTTTGIYDARALYAGFGQYSTGSGHVYGWHDDFIIIDTVLSYSDSGTGFFMIDAYIDEVFTHTFYDIDEGLNSTLEIDPSVTNITLLIQCWLNATAYDVSSVAEGKNIIRHNVTVTNTNGTVVFSQNNFTYLSGFDYGDGLFLYQYSVQLDFTLTYGEIYRTIITYEVYY
jgi:hypothetical protein